MHIEILVEDQSGKKFLDIILQKIIFGEHTFKVHAYKGIGRIPKNLQKVSDADRRILLDQLPRLLKGYGDAFARYPVGYRAAVIVVCDLDDKALLTFRQELQNVLNACVPKPDTHFCIAVEEGEAWLLGDIPAIKSAYPRAKDAILGTYVNDAICGTWEKLADAVYPGGSRVLAQKGWQTIGAEKSNWAEKITPHMVEMTNRSPSFHVFHETIQGLLAPLESIK